MIPFIIGELIVTVTLILSLRYEIRRRLEEKDENVPENYVKLAAILCILAGLVWPITAIYMLYLVIHGWMTK